jgi:diguanylate cyclase (GGDEF)-like protein
VTDAKGGIHPWERLVHRLGRIPPHRQLYLLCAIALVVAGLISVAVLDVLVPTRSSLAQAKRELVPPIAALDVAEQSYRATTGALQRAVSPDVAIRTEALAELTELNARGDGAWAKYRRIAVGLPGERALRRRFVANRKAALTAGGAFVTSPTPSAEPLALLTRVSAELTRDLDRIKDLYDERIQLALDGAESDVGSAARDVALIAIPSLVGLLAAFGLAIRSARARERRLEELDRSLHEEAQRNELEARLQRAFEMAHSEAAAFELTGRALEGTATGHPAELLVADSSRAHFRQVARSDSDGPGCPVMSPLECPAASWGQTQVWSSSTALDACPYLQGRSYGACSAACVPVSIGGNAVGVVHAIGPDERPPEPDVVGTVTMIARKVGERVGMLRAFERSETQAHTDPLTGLMNRRNLEAQVRELSDRGHSYVAAYGDLDHFKQLNDVHGHDAGDRALRLFARVLRDTVRPNDLTSRYGGEEFVVVLPDCSMDDAFVVIDRIRERLALAQVSGVVPRFTVSFGIAPSRPELTFSEVLESADAALLRAKATGRDRVVVSGEDGDARALTPTAG